MGDREGGARIVIEQRALGGRREGDSLQRVATVYLGGLEYRVYAPAKASGNPLDWLEHLLVRRPSPIGVGAEIQMDPLNAVAVIKHVKDELERLSRGSETKLCPKSSGPYYHVRLHVVNDPNIEVRFDLTRAELEERILEPYENLRPIVVGGRTFPTGELARVEIFESPYPSSQFMPMTADLARRVIHNCFDGEPDVKDLTDELIKTPSFDVLPQKTDAVELLCLRFHLVAKELRDRHQGRETLDVRDEYDVQDLFRALLRVFFDDVRKEEVTPSFAGKSSRMDFLLPSEQLVIEAKRSRPSLGARELGSELIDDITRYRAHPSCKRLICFVYDPEGYVANPRGIEADLSHIESGVDVKVLIAPRD